MAVVIIATILILAIAFYQAVQGMFSAIIMALLSVLCVALAFNFYEPMAEALIGAGLQGSFGHGTSLLALFVIPLLVLRICFDRFLRGNVVMGLWADRIGGGAFGLVTGMVLVGMLMIILQLLPLPASFLGFRPYTDSLEPAHGMGARLAARFTLGLARRLSAGGLAPIGGGEKFGEAHDDLLLDAFCVRNRPPGARASAPLEALGVVEAHRLQVPPRGSKEYAEWKKRLLSKVGLTDKAVERLVADVDRIQETVPKYPLLSSPADTVVYVVRLTVDEQARDTDDWYRLPATHFRLLTESHKSYYPVGYLTFCGRWRVETALDEKGKCQIAKIVVARPWQEMGGPKRLQVDWVYRLPASEKPRAVVFRRVARSRLPIILDGLPARTNLKGEMVALTVLPKAGATEFAAPPSPRLIRPVSMTLDDRLESSFRLRIAKSGQNPEIFRNASFQEGALKAGFIHCLASDLRGKVPRSSGRSISRFYLPGRNYGVLRVDCKVNPAAAERDRELLEAINPRLILDDGSGMAHNGALLIYGPKGWQRAFMYYDSSRTAPRYGEFVKLLGDNLGTVSKLSFVFVVPRTEGRSAAGISFVADPAYRGKYDFFPTRPLSLGDR